MTAERMTINRIKVHGKRGRNGNLGNICNGHLSFEVLFLAAVRHRLESRSFTEQQLLRPGFNRFCISAETFCEKILVLNKKQKHDNTPKRCLRRGGRMVEGGGGCLGSGGLPSLHDAMAQRRS
jgi:hypothetical protein